MQSLYLAASLAPSATTGYDITDSGECLLCIASNVALGLLLTQSSALNAALPCEQRQPQLSRHRLERQFPAEGPTPSHD